jgi:hypothetical protein
MVWKRAFKAGSVAALGTIAAFEAIHVPTWWAQFMAAFAGRRERWDASDFSAFYSAGKVVLQGNGHQLLHAETLMGMEHAYVTLPSGDALPFLNPPFFAGLMSPLAAALPFDRAYQAWSVASLCVLTLVCVQLWQLASPLDARWRALAVLGFLTMFPLTYALRQGQFSILLVASLGGAYLSLRDGRDRVAGLWLAPLLLKPELLLPIVGLLAWKRRRAVFVTLVPLACLAVVASVAIVGVQEALRYPSYLRSISMHGGIGTFTPDMYGWNGLLGATLGANRAGAETLAHAPLALMGLALAGVMWRGPWRPRDEAFAGCWLALILATVLADPHLYLQDTVLVVPAAVSWVATTRPEGQGARGITLLCGWVVMGLGSQPNIALHTNAFALVMACGLAALVIERTRGGYLAPTTIARSGAADEQFERASAA